MLKMNMKNKQINSSQKYIEFRDTLTKIDISLEII